MTNLNAEQLVEQAKAISDTEKAQEEQLDRANETKVARGFHAMVFGSDIMQRYGFSLGETRGGRIFVDRTNGFKLRRAIVRGQPQQNYMFEAYETVDNAARSRATVEISSNGFTPSMLLAAVAAKVSKEGNAQYNSIAVMFIQVAAALLQDGEAGRRNLAKIQENATPERKQFNEMLFGMISRANAITAMVDLLDNLVRDDDVLSSGFADLMEGYTKFRNDHLSEVGRTKEGAQFNEDDAAEASNTLAMLFSSITNFAFSNGTSTIMEMADEYKNQIGEAVQVELNNGEQK